MPTVTVDGIPIFYATAGEGDPGGSPAIVFLHGAGGSHENWQKQLHALAPRGNAVAVDLPGHGKSGGDGHRTIAAYRDFVDRLLAALGLDRPVLVGHSMGGAIVQAMALAWPERLKGLVLVGTGARLRVSPKIFEAIAAGAEEAAAFIARWAYSSSFPPHLLADGERALRQAPAEVMEGDFRACDAFDAMEQVGRIRLPTLVVCGAEDQLTPAKYAEYLHRQIAGSRLRVIPRAGHMVMLERAAEFNAALADFLASLPA